jgi:CheY-like chemotaxis protein
LILDDLAAAGGRVASGASFTFWLPQAGGVGTRISPPPPPKGDGAAGAATRSAPFQDVTILVVDDEEAIRSVLERYFRKEGATVKVAAGGSSALETIRREPVDIVVLDLRMPDLGGAEVYQIIQNEKPALADRTIFLSGDATRATEELQVPPGRVLVKPVELQDLTKAVLQVRGG